jgi:hypothetical protein
MAAKDITYVTSINSLMQFIRVKFPNAHLDAAFQFIHADIQETLARQ